MVLHETVLTSPDTTPLFLMMLPRHELPVADAAPFPSVIEWVLRDVGPIMSHERWASLWEGIARATEWHMTEASLRALPPPYIPYIIEWKQRKELERVRNVIERALRRDEFTQLVLEGLMGLPARQLQLPLFGFRFRAWYVPILYTSPVLLAVYAQLTSQEFLKELGASEEEVISWTLVTSLLARAGNPRVARVREDFMSCEVAVAASKEIASAKLKELIAQARWVAFTPLVPAVARASSLIEQGQFVLALETALASGMTAVMFAGTFSLVEWVLDLPRRKRRGD